MFCFDGIIEEKLSEQLQTEKKDLANDIQKMKAELSLNPRLIDLINKKDCYEYLANKEFSGSNSSGEIENIDCYAITGVSNTGLQGVGKFTKRLDEELERTEAEIENVKNELINGNFELHALINEYNQKDGTYSYDYIKRSEALKAIKDEHDFAKYLQLALMLIFILVDIIPLLLVTFTSPTMYDKILTDTNEALVKLAVDSRKTFLQELYKFYHSIDGIHNKNLSNHNLLRSINRGIDKFKKVEDTFDITIVTVFLGVVLGLFGLSIISSPRILELTNIDIHDNIISNLNVAKTMNVIDTLEIKQLASGTALSALIIATLANVLSALVTTFIPWLYRSLKALVSSRRTT